MALAVTAGMTDLPIRAAATVILWRAGPVGPQVLMGQRGAGAAFMPSKYVFPGGAVDPGDASGPAPLLPPGCAARLAAFCPEDAPAPQTLAAAALRELAEETGLAPAPGADWRFVFRAITPPGRWTSVHWPRWPMCSIRGCSCVARSGCRRGRSR